MKPQHSHLGFVDWGIGGLTVLSEVLKQEPHLHITYVSDAGHTPYGKLTATTLTDRLSTLFQWMQSQGCDGVVVACNAASSALLQTRAEFPLPIYDVITPTVRFLRESSYARIGVIGGDATVESHVYRTSLPKISVLEQSAQPLSALIEEGRLSANEVMPLLKTVFTGFKNTDLQALVLACTHYPAVASLIAELEPEWMLIDPAVALAQSLSEQLAPSASPTKRYFTTGSQEQTITSAQKAFGFTIPQVKSIKDLLEGVVQ